MSPDVLHGGRHAGQQAAAIVVAAGRSERFGRDVRKPFVDLAGMPVVVRALLPFHEVEQVAAVVLVVAEPDVLEARQLVATHSLRKVVAVVVGGATRSDSVRLGLDAIPAVDLVLVHDGARPLADAALVRRVLSATATHGAAIPVVTPRDTVKTIEQDLVRSTLRRTKLGLAQTPQGFRVDLLRRAYRQSPEVLGVPKVVDVTDDAELVERLGEPVAVVEGADANIKITRASDLVIAAALIGAGAQRSERP